MKCESFSLMTKNYMFTRHLQVACHAYLPDLYVAKVIFIWGLGSDKMLGCHLCNDWSIGGKSRWQVVFKQKEDVMQLKKMKVMLVLAMVAGVLVGCAEKTQSEALKIGNVVVTTHASEQDKAEVNNFLRDKMAEVQKLSQPMSADFAGALSLDLAHATNDKGVAVPQLVYNGKPLNNDHTIPEKLSAQTGGQAASTVFVKAGEEFVRISTSIKRDNASDDGKGENRAVGSTLSHTNPAYAACLEGKAYAGDVALFGKIYAGEYQPLKDKAGQVIGIQFVGMDITSDVYQLKKKLGSA